MTLFDAQMTAFASSACSETSIFQTVSDPGRVSFRRVHPAHRSGRELRAGQVFLYHRYTGKGHGHGASFWETGTHELRGAVSQPSFVQQSAQHQRHLLRACLRIY